VLVKVLIVQSLLFEIHSYYRCPYTLGFIDALSHYFVYYIMLIIYSYRLYVHPNTNIIVTVSQIALSVVHHGP